ncbi:MAG: siderophore-interacting protein [Corynebacterium sp.]|nr:siderophore-interacting protein [Corynebacterium sp.]
MNNSTTTSTDEEVVTSVLSSEEHTRGLSELAMEVTSVTPRHPWLVRVTGHVAGITDHAAWEPTNLAVRLAIPDPGDAIGEMTGQPDTCRRVYTVAAFDRDTATLDVDVVVHGEDSPMMCWLRGLTPGDLVPFAGRVRTPRRRAPPPSSASTCWRTVRRTPPPARSPARWPWTP